MGCPYSRKDNPTTSDLVMIYDSENSDWRVTSISQLFTLFSESFTNTVLEPGSQYSAPLTGADITVGVNDNDTHLLIVPAGTLAELTITLPAPTNLRDKQLLIVTCSQIVTTLTVDGNGASSVNGAPTAFTANGYFTLKYDLALDSWNRIA